MTIVCPACGRDVPVIQRMDERYEIAMHRDVGGSTKCFGSFAEVTAQMRGGQVAPACDTVPPAKKDAFDAEVARALAESERYTGTSLERTARDSLITVLMRGKVKNRALHDTLIVTLLGWLHADGLAVSILSDTGSPLRAVVLSTSFRGAHTHFLPTTGGHAVGATLLEALTRAARAAADRR